ncbi:chaperonin, 10 kDa, putative [Perkinsus marinus ATCC 50983]|uniref:Chaperonin, 10 kDa, putative n=1 Tax=Perkinsus marinus (strain ATCC 50983 / TXsc) TaxID=423536 RepID=C5L970_PERM5|nr:chaperonin, 10 kDa, putative [Perkinsus marinus ATCC 50983]EER06718.1 chaperonin, 10 kDa, putative [Perkinsus marinus ATCC 50983]|eukprot:XP_002774902.1 chaperonin, 10 kDa, putative [Perkinsus marinus ATCC 50983]
MSVVQATTAASKVANRFIPLLDRVLVQKLRVESKTATGVFLPEAAKPTINQAVVMAVGSGRVLNDGTKIPISVQPGDKVIIPEFGGMNLKLDGEDFQVFRDDDIVGKIVSPTAAAETEGSS